MATHILKTKEFSNHPDRALRKIEEDIDLLLKDLYKKQWFVTVMSEYLTNGDKKFITNLTNDIVATSRRIENKTIELGKISYDISLHGD
jgi:hypothetical protein